MTWPDLPYAAWEPTKQTLHRYTQIVGKVRMALVPRRNHWWRVTLTSPKRGLSPGPMPYEDQEITIDLDLLAHRLLVRTRNGRHGGFDLRDRPACADFYTS